jgi:hypothetical protein
LQCSAQLRIAPRIPDAPRVQVFAPMVGTLAQGGILGADAFLYVAGACAAADLAFLAAAEALCGRLARKQKHKVPRVADQP